MRRIALKISFVILSTVFLSLHVGAQANRTAQVPKCDCTPFMILPQFDEVKAGELVEFEISSNNDAVLKRKFKWNVSAGTIVSGQGTTKIQVSTTADMANRAAIAPPPTSSEGYIFSGSIRRRVPTITAKAEYDDQDCTCHNPVSQTIRVGDHTVPRNGFADVTKLTLSESNMVLDCVPGQRPREGQVVSKTKIIDVTTSAHDPENDVITYEYTVSAGRIVGKGPKVQWDLSGLQPGTYTITAGVDDGCGICGKTLTQEVTITESECIIDPECPDISIAGPPLLQAESVFTANVVGGPRRASGITGQSLEAK